MAFELWDTRRNRRIGEYPTRREALRVAHEIGKRGGRAAVTSLILARQDERGEPRMLATGTALAELVAEEAAAVSQARQASRRPPAAPANAPAAARPARARAGGRLTRPPRPATGSPSTPPDTRPPHPAP